MRTVPYLQNTLGVSVHVAANVHCYGKAGEPLPPVVFAGFKDGTVQTEA